MTGTEQSNNQLIVVDPKEFKLSEQEAAGLTKGLHQILSERDEITKQYDEVVKMNLDDPESAPRASEMRKLIKNNRTQGIEKWHKTSKEVFLRGGQFVDAIKRKEVTESKRMEDQLEKIEKHKELESKRLKDELRTKRVTEIENISPGFIVATDLGEMPDNIYEAFKNGIIESDRLKAEAEKKT